MTADLSRPPTGQLVWPRKEKSVSFRASSTCRRSLTSAADRQRCPHSALTRLLPTPIDPEPMTTGGSASAEIFARLADQYARSLDALVPPGPVALLDFPNHPNVGDSAIWLGERRWLRRTSLRPVAYVAAADQLDPAQLRAAMPTGTVLIHGGGNFGDIWSWHQEHRERALDALRDYRVVQLPQSIRFTGESAVRSAQRAIERHPDVIVTVRSEQSLDWARRQLPCDVHLVPDGAVMLPPMAVPAPACDVVLLKRTDRESGALGDLPGATPEDWLRDADWMRTRWARAVSRRLLGRAGLASTVGMAWADRLAAARLRRGLQQLARGRVIVTDRLHAALLALRIDRPTIAVDNNYGKLGHVLGSWFSDARELHFVRDPSEVTELAARLAKPGGTRAPADKPPI
jgi:exopolysaccharide biosynthesis protein PssK